MKKITKYQALYKITQFGRTEQHALIESHMYHEAYQIEHARNRMLYELVGSGISGVRKLLPRMIGTAAEHDALTYVADDETRALLIKFSKAF